MAFVMFIANVNVKVILIFKPVRTSLRTIEAVFQHNKNVYFRQPITTALLLLLNLSPTTSMQAQFGLADTISFRILNLEHDGFLIMFLVMICTLFKSY